MTQVCFAPRDRFLLWLAAGWDFEDDLEGTAHGAYSVLMSRATAGFGMERSSDYHEPAQDPEAGPLFEGEEG